MDSVELRIETGGASGVFDLTTEVVRFCSGRGDGLVSVFVPHATAGVAVFETGAGSDADVIAAIDELLPADPSRVGVTSTAHPGMAATTSFLPSSAHH